MSSTRFQHKTVVSQLVSTPFLLPTIVTPIEPETPSLFFVIQKKGPLGFLHIPRFLFLLLWPLKNAYLEGHKSAGPPKFESTDRPVTGNGMEAQLLSNPSARGEKADKLSNQNCINRLQPHNDP